MSTRSYRWICLLCIFVSSALAQQNGPARPASSAAVGASDHAITLDVVVTDKSGQPVRDLQQQDFTLLDNKAPQKITSFQEVQRPTASSDPPVEVILVIDQVNASFTNAGVERQAVEGFLKQNGGELVHPVSIVLFSDSGAAIGSTPTQDAKTLIAELNQSNNSLRTIGRSQGVYGAVDRLQLSLRTLGQLADYNRRGQVESWWFGSVPAGPFFPDPIVI